MITYVILALGDEPIGYIRSDGPPSHEEMADHLAILAGFADRDAFLMVNPGLCIGYCQLH